MRRVAVGLVVLSLLAGCRTQQTSQVNVAQVQRGLAQVEQGRREAALGVNRTAAALGLGVKGAAGKVEAGRPVQGDPLDPEIRKAIDAARSGLNRVMAGAEMIKYAIYYATTKGPSLLELGSDHEKEIDDTGEVTYIRDQHEVVVRVRDVVYSDPLEPYVCNHVVVAGTGGVSADILNGKSQYDVDEKTVNVEHGWAYLTGYWPRARTSRGRAHGHGTTIVVQVQNDSANVEHHRFYLIDPVVDKKTGTPQKLVVKHPTDDTIKITIRCVIDDSETLGADPANNLFLVAEHETAYFEVDAALNFDTEHVHAKYQNWPSGVEGTAIDAFLTYVIDTRVNAVLHRP